MYIQDMKIDVFDGKGDLTTVCQFFPFAHVEDYDNWMDIK